MKKNIFIVLALSSILSASMFVCKGDYTSVAIKTDGDYVIKVSINGRKYDGVWKGSTVDKKGKPIKLYYLYGKDNIWIHSQNKFKNITIRFHSDMDNMYIRYLNCKVATNHPPTKTHNYP